MESIVITKNNNAIPDFVLCYMQSNYPNFVDIVMTDTDITFNATVWQAGEESTITAWYNGLTASDNCTSHELEIYEYITTTPDTDKHIVPKDLDYIRSLNIRLHPIITDVEKGEVREITYYSDISIDPNTGIQTGIDPVVKEHMVYTRDADLLAISRDMTITWFKQDGTEHSDTKTRLKYYTNEQRITEGVRRRQNIIDFMQVPLLGMLVQTVPTTNTDAVTLGGAFFEDYVVEIETYYFSPRNNVLQNAVTNDTTHTWLNNVVNTPASGDTIRDYILDQLNY